MTPGNSRWKLGFGLALGVAALWGVLPIILRVALTELDAWTITWWRFAGAAAATGAWLAFRGELPDLRLRDGKVWRWLVPTCLGLLGNYVLYLLGLSYTSPAVSQTVMQIAPLLLLLFGMFVLDERFSRQQWVGFALLLAGMAIFFNRRLPLLINPSEGWSFGVFLLIGSSFSWATYGLGQKKLSRHMSATQILFLLYAGATVLLLPTADPGAILNLHRPAFLALLFGVLNTIAAYGAFGLALEVWEVSRVSSVVAAAPLFTLAASMIGAYAALAWITPESLNALSLAGAACVFAGSVTTALGRRRA